MDASLECRQNLKEWQALLSDIEGCLDACEPRVAAPTGSRVQWPTLSLLDHPEALGWTPHAQVVSHGKYDEAVPCDSRNMHVGRKHHLLALLLLEALFDEGSKPLRNHLSPI
eukprot:3580773-Pyramimonas_sp.AAC.1